MKTICLCLLIISCLLNVHAAYVYDKATNLNKKTEQIKREIYRYAELLRNFTTPNGHRRIREHIKDNSEEVK